MPAAKRWNGSVLGASPEKGKEERQEHAGTGKANQGPESRKKTSQDRKEKQDTKVVSLFALREPVLGSAPEGSATEPTAF